MFAWLILGVLNRCGSSLRLEELLFKPVNVVAGSRLTERRRSLSHRSVTATQSLHDALV